MQLWAGGSIYITEVSWDGKSDLNKCLLISLTNISTCEYIMPSLWMAEYESQVTWLVGIGICKPRETKYSVIKKSRIYRIWCTSSWKLTKFLVVNLLEGKGDVWWILKIGCWVSKQSINRNILFVVSGTCTTWNPLNIPEAALIRKTWKARETKREKEEKIREVYLRKV